MTKEELIQLKAKVGKQPFISRLSFDGQDFAACPFHCGDSKKSMHLKQQGDGAWVATCFSECGKSWDTLAFVMELDKISFPEACKLLAGLPADTTPQQAKPKPRPMTREQWSKWGREITQADVDEFAASRTHSHTAPLEYFRMLGVRVKDGYLGFPYTRTVDGKTEFSGVKMRKFHGVAPGEKDFIFANAVDTSSLFNIDAVNLLEDAYVVEGEPDVLTMAASGFVAVSPFSGKQNKFNAETLKQLAVAPRIFVVGDQDAAGKEFADRIQKVLPREKTYRITFSEAKDVGELALKLGDALASKIEELRDDSTIPPTPWIEVNIPRIHELHGPPKTWLVDRMLPYGGLTQISALQGGQKSLLALKLAQCIASGRDFLGRPSRCPMGVLFCKECGKTVIKGYCLEHGEQQQVEMPEITFNPIPVPRVVYIDRENPKAEIEERAKKLGIVFNKDFHYWGEWESQGYPPEPDDERLLEYADRYKPYFFFDSLQQWLDGESENDPAAMTKLMRRFRMLARRSTGCTVLAHNNKPDRKTGKSTSRGTTAIVANTDMAIRMAKEDGIIKLREDRFRGCAPWEMDYKVNFGERYYIFELLRDETEGEAVVNRMKEEKEQREASEKARFESEAPDRAACIEVIRNKPTVSLRTVERDTGIKRTRVERLLDEAGYKFEGGKWTTKADGTESEPSIF